MADSIARGFLGAGDGYINRYDPDLRKFVGWEGPFETGKYEIKPNSTLKDLTSKGRVTYGQLVESVPIPAPFEFTIEFREINKSTLTFALMGTTSGIAQPAADITAEAIVSSADKFSELVNLMVSNVVVKDGAVAFAGTGAIATTTLTVTLASSGTLSPGQTIAGSGITVGTRIVSQLTSTETDGSLGKKGTYKVTVSQTFASAAFTGTVGTGITYDEGDDYVLNERLGWVKGLSTGAIFDGQPLKVDYHAAAVSGTQIDGATQTQVRAQFKLDGVNFVDNSPCIVTILEGVSSADQAFDFLADDFNTATLAGRLKTPAGQTKPFTVKLLD